MASRQSLRRIGEEAFRMIDQEDERKQQRLLYHSTKPTVYHIQTSKVSNVGRAYHVQVIPVPNVEREDQGGMLDCYEAAKRYGCDGLLSQQEDESTAEQQGLLGCFTSLLVLSYAMYCWN